MAALTRFVFLGAPGVGKGSFAAIIGSQLGLATVGAGDLVREEVKQGTRMGNQIKAFSDAGQLAPDEIVSNLVKARLERPDAARGFILVRGFIMDGFPRNLAQAAWLESAEIALDRVLNITLPEWVTLRKITARRHCTECGGSFNLADIHEDGFEMPSILPDFDTCDRGRRCPRTLHRRKDDTEDIIKQRLEVYRTATAPLIEFYEERGLLRHFEVRTGLAESDAMVEAMTSQ